jgi:hypothetical protein
LLIGTGELGDFLIKDADDTEIFRPAAGDGAAFRLEFASKAEAVAFVGAFGGRLIRPEPDASAAA